MFLTGTAIQKCNLNLCLFTYYHPLFRFYNIFFLAECKNPASCMYSLKGSNVTRTIAKESFIGTLNFRASLMLEGVADCIYIAMYIHP